MRSLSLIILLLMCYQVSKSQVHGGIEQYYYTGIGESSVVPRVYFKSSNNWYGEVRYNYEELQTVSVNAGKTFSTERAVMYSITPFAGIVLGKLTGGTLGGNLEVEYKDLFFSSESQYTFSIRRKTESFFFNWSEVGYQLNDLLYAGVALQLTHPYESKNNWEPGFMVGLTFKSWTFPFYTFSPGKNNRNFVLGVNWQWANANREREMYSCPIIL